MLDSNVVDAVDAVVVEVQAPTKSQVNQAHDYGVHTDYRACTECGTMRRLNDGLDADGVCLDEAWCERAEALQRLERLAAATAARREAPEPSPPGASPLKRGRR